MTSPAFGPIGQFVNLVQNALNAGTDAPAPQPAPAPLPVVPPSPGVVAPQPSPVPPRPPVVPPVNVPPVPAPQPNAGQTIVLQGGHKCVRSRVNDNGRTMQIRYIVVGAPAPQIQPKPVEEPKAKIVVNRVMKNLGCPVANKVIVQRVTK